MLFLKFNEYSKAEHEDLSKQIPGERSFVLEMKSLAMYDAYHIGQFVMQGALGGSWNSDGSVQIGRSTI